MALILIVISFIFGLFNSGINFQESQLSSALERAEREGKLVFVDTYADWCKPCKQMDVVFRDKRLGKLFDRHYISVKVNMDGEQGKSIQGRYQIVWLPTMLILEPDGDIRIKIDRLVNAQELLDAASKAINNSQLNVQSDVAVRRPTKSGQSAKEVETTLVTEQQAPIIYVYDERSSSGRPHIMYHEAYLHMQLMDGKQSEVAKKYLSTQEDWSSEKNLRFIFDFVADTRSKEFEYLVRHKSLFSNLIGKEKVDESIRILVYQRLHNGLPRPNLDEAKNLFAVLYSDRAEQLAYDYFLKRLLEKGEDADFLYYGQQYLTHVNPYDDRMIYTYVGRKMKSSDTTEGLEDLVNLMDRALMLSADNAAYHLIKAELYYLKQDKAAAGTQCQLALKFARQQQLNIKPYENLQRRIYAL